MYTENMQNETFHICRIDRRILNFNISVNLKQKSKLLYVGKHKLRRVLFAKLVETKKSLASVRLA